MIDATDMSESESRIPTVAITMGDPSGIGAEVIVKALADPHLRLQANFLVYGFSETLDYAADRAELNLPWLRHHHEDRVLPAGLTVLDYDELPTPPAGEYGPTAFGGRASMAFLEDAIAAADKAHVDALVTAPISKQSWHMAGFKFPGHTELLAKRTGTKNFAMMFVSPRLNVILATIHIGLLEIRDHLNIGCVFNAIDLGNRALRGWFGQDKPRIAVCGLNPHAGEGGAFGDEERRIIEPAILMAAETGVDVRGPFPADTIFPHAAVGEYDLVVAMYHDQGMIPIKLLAMHQSVNLTLGLPIVRTSPAHGTAFDIAGSNRADPGSMKAAIQLAIDLARRRMRATHP